MAQAKPAQQQGKPKMVRVKMRRTSASPNGVHHPDDIVSVDMATAKQLEDAHAADIIRDNPKGPPMERADAPPPEIR